MTRVTTENHIISQAKRSIVIFWTKPTFFGHSESPTRIREPCAASNYRTGGFLGGGPLPVWRASRSLPIAVM
jgi:hypothetical protein